MSRYLGNNLLKFMKTKSEYISISKIEADPNQPRKLFEAGKLATLKSSVKKHGIMTPLVVEAVGGKFLLVDGERRFRVATELGLTEVPAVIISPQSKVDRIIQQFHIQEQHEGWNATEKAMVVHELSQEMDIPIKQLGEMLGLSERTTHTYIAFSRIVNKALFQKHSLSVEWAQKIQAFRKYTKVLYEKHFDEEFDRQKDKEFETVTIKRIADGQIRTITDITKVKDSFKTQPESIKEYLSTDVTPSGLFSKTKAKGAYHYRQVINHTGYLTTHIRAMLESGGVKLSDNDVSRLKWTKKVIDSVLDKVE